MSLSVIYEQLAVVGYGVAGRLHAAAHKQIKVAVAVRVQCFHATIVGVFGLKIRPRKLAFSVVQVQSVLQQFIFPRILIAAAHHVQICVAVGISIKKNSVNVLVYFVGFKNGLGDFDKRAIGFLHKQNARLTFGTARIKVSELVTVHIANGHSRTRPRVHRGQKYLAVEINCGVFDVRKIGNCAGRENRFFCQYFFLWCGNGLLVPGRKRGIC